MTEDGRIMIAMMPSNEGPTAVESQHAQQHTLHESNADHTRACNDSTTRHNPSTLHENCLRECSESCGTVCTARIACLIYLLRNLFIAQP